MLRFKPQAVTTINKAATVRDAVRLMKEHGISQLPVVDEGHLAGLVTESKLLELMINEGEAGLEVSLDMYLAKNMKS